MLSLARPPANRFRGNPFAERESQIVNDFAASLATSEKVKREDIWLGQPGLVVFTLENAFTPSFCKDAITLAEEKDRAKRKPTCGNPQELQGNIESSLLQNVLWARIKDFIPSVMIVGGERWNVVGLRPNFRIHKYHPGRNFPPHRDAEAFKNRYEKSLLSVMIYLNDGTFESGTTNFLSEEDDSLIHAILPQAGKILIFQHDLWHEGATVNGGKKYFMRNEIMYRNVAWSPIQSPNKPLSERPDNSNTTLPSSPFQSPAKLNQPSFKTPQASPAQSPAKPTSPFQQKSPIKLAL